MKVLDVMKTQMEVLPPQLKASANLTLPKNN
jgi:hypothetical protein